MSLIQDPVRALRQARWYLANTQLEQLPSAFSLAAGNILRQLVEQILFALSFYSGLPKNRYIRDSKGLHTAGRMLHGLRSIQSPSRRSYLQIARNKHPYLRLLARRPATFQRWVNLLNPPSHFANPVGSYRTPGTDLESLTTELESLVTPTLFHLVIAAANELRSDGRLRAVFGKDAERTVAVECDIIVAPKHLVLEGGQLALRAPTPPIRIVSSEEGNPIRRSGHIVMVQHQARPSFQARLLASDGRPIDLSSTQTIIGSLARTPARRRAVTRRLRLLGIRLEWKP